MKKKSLKILLLILVCTIMFISGGAAAVSLTAKDVVFTSSHEDWKVDNVEDAMNDLYNISKDVMPSISKVATTSSGVPASTMYYGKRLSSVSHTYNMNQGTYVVFVYNTYNDIYSSTATGGDVSNKTTVAGGIVTKINDYCFVVDVEEDGTDIVVNLSSDMSTHEDRRSIYAINIYN